MEVRALFVGTRGGEGARTSLRRRVPPDHHTSWGDALVSCGQLLPAARATACRCLGSVLPTT